MILDNAMTCHFVRSSRSDRLFVRLSVVNAIIRKRMNRFLPRDARPMQGCQLSGFDPNSPGFDL